MTPARSGVEFSALGPLEICVGGEFLALQSSQLRLLTAALLVSWNEVVSTDRLIDVVWTGRERSPPHDALAALHTLVHRLRAALTDGSDDGGQVIVTRPPGYLIQTNVATFDVPRFEEAVERARRATREGDTHAAVSAYDEALALWRGPAFAEFVYDDFARVEAARLDEARLVAVEDRAELKLSLGRHAELVGELEGVVEEHPYRERLCATLMLALYRAGRQADALRAYALLRSTLGEDLGIEPSAAVRDLETAMVRQEAELQWEPESGARDAPAASAPQRSRSRVPIALSEIFGRERAIADADALSTARIVTLTGSPGVGKTRLAAEVTNLIEAQYDGVAWCELAGVSEADVARVIATALQVRPERGEEVLTAIVDAMWSSEVVIVLDNCEHVIDGVARVVETIERGCAGARILATSREPLGTDGEVVLRVAPLDPASALQLFATRARGVREDFRLDDANADAVARICARLDGVPLAIELAAARVTTLPPADLANRLDDRFTLLSAGRRTAAARHQSLRAAIDWSYDLLEADDQRVLRCVGVFRGGFSLEAAEAVAAEDPPSSAPVWPRLDDLVRRSLVSVDAGVAETRFRLLETVREYAYERLVEAGDADVVAARHGRYFAAFVESAAEPLTTAAEAAWTARVDRELDNISIALDRAIERADLDVALRIVSQAGEPVFSWSTGFNQAIDRSAPLAVHLDGADDDVRFPGAASGAAWLACDRGDLVTAALWADEAFAAEARLGTTPPLFYPWIVHANIAISHGDLDEAVQHWARAVAIMRDIDAPALAGPLSFLASLRGGTGDRAVAGEEAQEAVRIARARGAPGALAIALAALAINIAPSEPTRAIHLIRESVAAQHSLGHPGAGRALVMAMVVAVRYCGRDEALALVDEALTEAQRPQLLGMALAHTAALIARDEPDTAAVLVGAANAHSEVQVNLARPMIEELHLDAVLVDALGEERDAVLRATGGAMDRATAIASAQAAVARARDREGSVTDGP